MEKFSKAFKVGTKVHLEGDSGYREVMEVHETRKWVRIKGLAGLFQRGHIEHYTNCDSVLTVPLHTTFIEDRVAALFARESVNSCGEFNERNNMSYLNVADIVDAADWGVHMVSRALDGLLVKGYITCTGKSDLGSHQNDFSANPSEYRKNGALKHLVTKEQ